jgi:hypothetical protein
MPTAIEQILAAIADNAKQVQRIENKLDSLCYDLSTDSRLEAELTKFIPPTVAELTPLITKPKRVRKGRRAYKSSGMPKTATRNTKGEHELTELTRQTYAFILGHIHANKQVLLEVIRLRNGGMNSEEVGETMQGSYYDSSRRIERALTVARRVGYIIRYNRSIVLTESGVEALGGEL